MILENGRQTQDIRYPISDFDKEKERVFVEEVKLCGSEKLLI